MSKNPNEDRTIIKAGIKQFNEYWEILSKEYPEYDTDFWNTTIGLVYLAGFSKGYDFHKVQTEELMSQN